MDIDTPDFILDSVQKRLKHPNFGYEAMPQSAFEAQKDWLFSHHGFECEVHDMFYSHSVVASLSLVIETFTKKGEGVIVSTPIYPPFFHTVLDLERKLITNPLHLDSDGRYSFDMQDLEAKITEDTKLLLLCSPHNPVGRVWRQEELEQILELCLRHNIIVFSDEIHSDLVYQPHKHIPFGSLKGADTITITAYGVGKTFNMAGFAISSVIIQNEALKKRFEQGYKKAHFAEGSVLSHVAFEAAYREGSEWVEALKEHLYGNFLRLEALCQRYPTLISVTPIEGSYLAWLDCRGMGLRDKKLREFFIKEAKLGLNAGISFSREGSGFMRLNFALSYDKMSEVIQRLEKALRGLSRDKH
jgi:cystathionine beta-lyase